jgi:pyrroloquinoline quinone biosynthesis protein B
MRLKILGSGAGGGFPQWNCGCRNCKSVRGGVPNFRSRTQAQVAISPSRENWILLNASPDLRQQILNDPELAPSHAPRGTPVSAIILTSADVDSVMGLLHLREFQPLQIYATPSVRRVLTEENTLFHVLERSRPPVRWENLPLDRAIQVSQASQSHHATTLFCRAVPMSGEFPDYVSGDLRASLRKEEAVVGLEFVQNKKRFFYAPALPGRDDLWKDPARQSDLVLLDGTFWTDDELMRVLGSGKTGRQMGHLPLSGAAGLLEQMKDARNARRVLVHLNNTKPVLDEDGAEHRELRGAGWEVSFDGMELQL